MGTITSEKKRVRKIFDPLTIAASVKLMTPLSGTNQVFNAGLSQYEPDRSATPLVLLPEVVAYSADGSWKDYYANKHLANYSWYVNDAEISTVAAWNDGFEIDTTETSERGAIAIKRNIPVGETVELQFKGFIYDHRLNINIPVETQKITLSTSAQSTDSYGISIGEDVAMTYNPFLDRLADYEYEVAHGLRSASASAQTAATDANSYQKTIPLIVNCGTKQITTGYSIQVLKRGSGSTFTQITTANAPELISVSNTAIVFDMRVIEEADYIVKVIVSDKVVAQTQFSFGRLYPEFFVRPASAADINPNDTIVRNTVLMQSNSQIVDHPARVCNIKWKTDTVGITAKVWQDGDTMIAIIADTGIGETDATNWLDMYCEAGQKDVYKVMTDGTNTYVDASGNSYIND